MTLPSQYGLLDSAYNEFLFALIGEDENGMEVSVISGLTRLGTDPWDEARRLAKLSSTAATNSLAGMIAGLAPIWSTGEASAIAARLVPLLPKGGSPAAPRHIGKQSRYATLLVLARHFWLQSICLVLLIAVIVLSVFNLK